MSTVLFIASLPLAAVVGVGAGMLCRRIERWIRSKHFNGEPYDARFADEPSDPVDERHDEYQRAAWFTGAEEAQLQATAEPPAVVAAEDLIVSKLIGELHSAYAAYRRGVDVCADAPREPSPEARR